MSKSAKKTGGTLCAGRVVHFVRNIQLGALIIKSNLL